MSSEAAWPQSTSVVDGWHWLVTLVSWYAQVLVFYNILFDDGLSSSLRCWLVQGLLIQVGLWDIAIVTWDVASDLGSSNAQFIVFIILFIMIFIKFRSWIWSISSKSSLGFSVVELSLWSVSNSWQAPLRSLRHSFVRFESLLNLCWVLGFPMLSWSSS